MGLLDDAIHEHLELKRLRGADPGLIAREEHSALGPVRGDESEGADDDGDSAHGGLASESAQPMQDDPGRISQPDQDQGFSHLGQETAELDMRTVLDDVPSHDLAPAKPGAVGPVRERASVDDARPEQSVADDPLEWEMPGDGASESHEHTEEGRHASAQDRHSHEASDGSNEPVEDVLEETPEFLRDTPEQERLWFEQRPPRDFDFDK